MITRRILKWRAPELTLVRARVDAFELVADGGPAKWRSISRRGKVAHHLRAAAEALEGPIARKFVSPAGPGEAAEIQERLLLASSALRGKVAWLATPRAETREFLAKVLARELVIAASGELDRLEYTKPDSANLPPTGWLGWFRRTLSWVALRFGPAIFLAVSKWQDWFDSATTVILAQFSAVCFLGTIFSMADSGGYKERLSAVTSTGTALFGWRKTEK
jgi:hypothetical protein